MAGNNHPRGAKAALRAMKASDTLCNPQHKHWHSNEILRSEHGARLERTLDSIEPNLGISHSFDCNHRTAIQAPNRTKAGIDALGIDFPCNNEGDYKSRQQQPGVITPPASLPVFMSRLCTCTEQAPHPPSPQPFFVPCSTRCFVTCAMVASERTLRHVSGVLLQLETYA